MHEPEIPHPSSLQLLIVDSDPVFRLGLRIWLEKFPDLQIVAEVNHAAAALEAMIPHQSEPRVEVLPLPWQPLSLPLAQNLCLGLIWSSWIWSWGMPGRTRGNSCVSN